jgi:hypothetical protein
MRTKLLISVLVLLLSGAESVATLICSASCMLSAQTARSMVHHHEMESQPSAKHSGQRAHHHGATCAECPAKVGNGLNLTSDCNSSSESQALRARPFSLNSPTAVARIQANGTAGSLALGSDGQSTLLVGDSPITGSSRPPSLPLRI